MSRCRECGEPVFSIDSNTFKSCQLHLTRECIRLMNDEKFIGVPGAEKIRQALFHEHYLEVQYKEIDTRCYSPPLSTWALKKESETHVKTCYLPRLLKAGDMTPMHSVKNLDLLKRILFTNPNSIEILSTKVYLNSYIKDMV